MTFRSIDKTRLSLLSLTVALLAMTAGCNMTNYRNLNPVERAQQIHSHIQEGQYLMRRTATNRDSLRNYSGTIKVFEDALDHFETAVELDDTSGNPPSAKPRIALGNCLHVIALFHADEANRKDEEIRIAEQGGGAASAQIKAESAALRKKSGENARRSNDVLVHYQTYLFGLQPEAMVFESIARNHEILGEWREAASALRAFVLATKFKKNDPRRIGYEKLIRAFEERAIDALDNES